MRNLAVVAVALLVSNTALAQAEVAKPFGSPGQVALFGRLSLSYEENALSTGYQGEFAPAVDVFVFSNLSVGAELGFGFFKTETVSSSGTVMRYSFGPRIGYQFDLGGRFSLWPRAFVGWDHLDTKDPFDANSLRFGAELPFIFRPVPHFLLGFGPRYTHAAMLGQPESALNGTDVIDFSLTLGGWF